MKNLVFAVTAMFSIAAFAGFQGETDNGASTFTSLGIFNKVSCSTGVTCTKYKDVFRIVSNPAITGGAFTAKAASATAATFDLQANANASNGDDWQIMSTTSEGGLKLLNNTSGSQVQKWLIDTSGNVTAAGNETINGGAASVVAASATAATIDVKANAAATNGDDWQIQSVTSEGGLKFLNNTSGSLVQKALLTTGGNLSVSGTFTPTGAITPTGGIANYDNTAVKTNWAGWLPKVAVTEANSTTPVATDVYMTQIEIPYNMTLTGINTLNAATCGSTKWILALFDDTGAPLANTALAGVTCSGTSAYQAIPFTGTVAVKGPGTYWVGLYANNTTDRFYTVPAFGAPAGLAGLVTGQTFGTVVAVTLPTTFTANQGPVAYTY